MVSDAGTDAHFCKKLVYTSTMMAKHLRNSRAVARETFRSQRQENHIVFSFVAKMMLYAKKRIETDAKNDVVQTAC